MRLYSNKASPFARKVHVVLHETGQTGDVETTAVSGTTLDPGNVPVALNPLAKLPVLELADGTALYDSRVICRYLDARAGGHLYPTDARQWNTLTLEATGDGIMDALLLMVYEGRLRPPENQYPPIVEAHWLKASRAMAALNARWAGHLGGPLDIGQIAVGCALGYADFRHADRDWRAENPALATWFAGFCERDSMRATLPEG